MAGIGFTVLPYAPGQYQPLAGNNNLTFVGTAGTPYTFQWGAAYGVVSDASGNVQINYPIEFPNALVSIQLTVSSGTQAPSGSSLSPEINSENTAGFQAFVSGGAVGSTCTVYWFAIGY
jgi:hypothetical protein